MRGGLSRLLATCAAAGALACGHGEPVERASIQNVAVQPGTNLLAALVKYERFRPPTGLSAFPDGGVPQVLELRADLYRLDAASAAVLGRTSIQASSRNRVAFEPWIAGWQDDTLYLSIRGCPGKPGDECYGRLVQRSLYRIGPDGAAVEISRFPPLVLSSVSEQAARFLGASRDSRTISIATHREGPYRPTFRIEDTRLVAGVASAPNR